VQVAWEQSLYVFSDVFGLLSGKNSKKVDGIFIDSREKTEASIEQTSKKEEGNTGGKSKAKYERHIPSPEPKGH
jgi:hypothetical protein